jgi:hypothetical protein
MSSSTPSAVSKNAEAIASLNRRKRRSLYLLLFFILLMPLGCAGPCGLTFVMPNETARMVTGISAMVLPLVGLVGTILMFSDSRKYKYSLRAVAVADQLGLTVVEKPKKSDYAILGQTRMYRDADTHSCGPLFQGEMNGIPVLLTDYHAVYGYGKNADIYSQTVVVLPADLPDFIVNAKGWLNFLEKLVGDKQFDFSDDATFHKTFIVRGDDEDEVRAALSPAVRSMLVVDTSLVIEVYDGHLFVNRLKRIHPPEKYAEVIAEAFRFAEALHPAT